MRNSLFFMILCMVVFSSCDPELNYFYSIENTGSDTIMVTATNEFELLDSTLTNYLIAPGETVEIAEYHFIGTTKSIEDDPIYIEILEIENGEGERYNKDPMDADLWERDAADKHNGYLLLKVSDDDF